MLGDVDQVRRILGPLLGQGRCCSQPAGVAPHDLHQLYGTAVAHGLGVQAGVANRGGHESRGAAIARAVVRHCQVVVDGLGDADGTDVIASLSSGQVDLVCGIHRVVPTDVEEVAHIVCLQDLYEPLVVLVSYLVAHGAQR